MLFPGSVALEGEEALQLQASYPGQGLSFAGPQRENIASDAVLVTQFCLVGEVFPQIFELSLLKT